MGVLPSAAFPALTATASPRAEGLEKPEQLRVSVQRLCLGKCSYTSLVLRDYFRLVEQCFCWLNNYWRQSGKDIYVYLSCFLPPRLPPNFVCSGANSKGWRVGLEWTVTWYNEMYPHIFWIKRAHWSKWQRYFYCISTSNIRSIAVLPHALGHPPLTTVQSLTSLSLVLERYSSSRQSNSGLNMDWLLEGELAADGEKAVAPVLGKIPQRLGEGGNRGRKYSKMGEHPKCVWLSDTSKPAGLGSLVRSRSKWIIV